MEPRQISFAEVVGGHDLEWHALYTRHQHEKLAAEILAHKGFEVFLPQYSAVHRWKDRNKRLWLPLFPCYLFLRGGLNRWLDIMTTPGIQSVVRSAGRAAAIPLAEIDGIRRMVESTFEVEPHPFLICGDRVRVKSGPLSGIEGILTRKKNHFRLVLTVEMLGKSAAVEVDAALIERVAKSTPRPAARAEALRLKVCQPAAV